MTKHLASDPGAQLCDRVNGDIRTHTILWLLLAAFDALPGGPLPPNSITLLPGAKRLAWLRLETEKRHE